MPRLAAKKDANHAAIVKDLRSVGLHVTDLAQVGNGVPDLLVTGLHRRANAVVALLVEVKTEKGKLTEHEERFFDEYPEGGPLIVARSSDDVLQWFGAIN